jgi:N-methylhydantoinase A
MSRRCGANSRQSTGGCNGHIQPSGRIEITALRVIGRTPLDWTPPAARQPQTAPPVPRETRAVWIDPEHGWRDVPVHDGAELRPGCKLEGRC